MIKLTMNKILYHTFSVSRDLKKKKVQNVKLIEDEIFQ